MTVLKIRQPVEYSFLQWINNYPDSGHWKDKERFLSFAKTVCRYHATNWKNLDFLKTKILKAKPHFDACFLNKLLDLYDTLIQFHKTEPCYDTQLAELETVEAENYIEIRVEKGIIHQAELSR